jgi:hypothetical protein
MSEKFEEEFSKLLTKWFDLDWQFNWDEEENYIYVRLTIPKKESET